MNDETKLSKQGQGVKVFGKDGKLVENVSSILIMDGRVFAVWAMEKMEDGSERKTWRFGSSVTVEITNFTPMVNSGKRLQMRTRTKKLFE